MKNQIQSLSSEYWKEIVDIRRHLHQNPELSLEEFQTSAFISSKLKEYGIEHQTGIAKTGIIGWIYGKNPEKKCIALRADMDALPMEEVTEAPFKSKNNGVMHACGHDMHMACLLGAAKILNALKDSFEGVIMLIFQPSEEKYPGGAYLMLKEGIFNKVRPSAIFAFHVLPEMEVGKVGFKAGQYMASTDEIYLTVKGKGGHAATPDMNVDPVLMASHIIVALQQVVSRNAPPTIPTILSFGKIEAKGRTNIIPDEVKIEGTIRTFNEEWRAKAHQKITQIAEGIAQSMGGNCHVFIDKGYPFLVNNAVLTAHAQEYADEYMGKENVESLDLRMTAEDFAFFAQEIPGCYFRVGTRRPGTEITNLHTVNFDVDEKALETGMGMMAWIAYKKLTNS